MPGSMRIDSRPERWIHRERGAEPPRREGRVGSRAGLGDPGRALVVV